MSRGPIPAEFKPEQVTAIRDSREQRPLDLSPLRMQEGTLATGDYSVLGLTDIVAIERKSLEDLIGCIGRERERFDREVQRLLAYPCRAVVVEAPRSAIYAGGWRGKVTPECAIASVIGWEMMSLPFAFCGGRDDAAKTVGRMLFTVARRRYREARALVSASME